VPKAVAPPLLALDWPPIATELTLLEIAPPPIATAPPAPDAFVVRARRKIRRTLGS